MRVLITGATGLLGGYLLQLREGIRLAAAWFNAGGMEPLAVTPSNQYAPLRGV